MKANKLRVIQDLEKLNPAIQKQLKLAYPSGYSRYLVELKTKDNQTVYAVPFETEDKIYMVRLNIQKSILQMEEDLDLGNEMNIADDTPDEED